MNGAFTVFLALQNRIYSICVLNTIPKFLTNLDILNLEEDYIEMPNLIKRGKLAKKCRKMYSCLLVSTLIYNLFCLILFLCCVIYLASLVLVIHSWIVLTYCKLFQLILFNLCTYTVLTKTRY